MTSFVTPTKSSVFATLRAFILDIVPAGIEVVQGLGNRVPMPKGKFIAITPISQTRLSTNHHIYDDTYPVIPGGQGTLQPTQYIIQIDCYGSDASDWATMLSTLLRDEIGCIALGPDVQPLYSDDPVQMALVDGEQQYDERWIVKARLQYNPVTQTVMEFFDVPGSIELIDVDVYYPD